MWRASKRGSGRGSKGKERRRESEGYTVDGGGSDRGYRALFTDKEEEEEQQPRGGEEMETKGRNMPSGKTLTHTCALPASGDTCGIIHAHIHIHDTALVNPGKISQMRKHAHMSNRKPPINTHTHTHRPESRCLHSEGIEGTDICSASDQKRLKGLLTDEIKIKKRNYKFLSLFNLMSLRHHLWKTACLLSVAGALVGQCVWLISKCWPIRMKGCWEKRLWSIIFI